MAVENQVTATTTAGGAPFGGGLPRSVPVATTLAEMFVDAATSRDSAAFTFHHAGSWTEMSFREAGRRVESYAKGLMGLGIEKGDRVAILSNTRAEWTLADFAGVCAGAVVVPIYQTNSPEECEYVLEHSEAKLVFVENADQLAKVDRVRANLPALEHVVMFEGATDPALSLDGLAAAGADVTDEALTERIASIGPEDPFTFIYTSGTTGPPKGCILTHANYRANVEQIKDCIAVEPGDAFYVFLPLAHALTRVVQMIAIERGATLAYWRGDPTKLIEDLAAVKPTHLPCVPRVFEKIYTTATAKVAEEGGPKEKIFNWALGVGRAHHRACHEGSGPGLALTVQHAVADKLVFAKIREMFGGRVRHCASGGAPIDKEIIEFFHAVGIPIFEGYGMTECAAAATFNTPHAYSFGSVGKAVRRCEVRLGEDGEVLMRGPNVFQGYHRNEEATAATLVDGWLHSGDLGRIDDDGFLEIVGRKKELIITSSGKNISPANIENQIKQSPWISQAVVFGDRKSYLVALVALDSEAAPGLAESIGAPTDLAAMAKDERVRAEVQRAIDEANANFASISQVKKWAFLPEEMSQENGELTPTFKMKRNVVYERHSSQFDELYAS